MYRTALSFLLLAVCSVSHAEVIDLLENPLARPVDKPASVQVSAAAVVDGITKNVNVTLSAIEYDTTTALVRYHQLNPVTLTWGSGDAMIFQNLSSVLDPTGSFAASFTDFGAPSTFTTTFSYPAFAPTIFGPVSFSGSVSGTVTDGAAIPNGVSYLPTGINPGVFRYELFDTTAALVATFFHDAGATFAAGPPNSHTTGPFDNSGSPLLVGAGPNGVGTVKVTSSFTGSGGTDQYAFTGRWDVLEVPEPSSLGLMITGLLGLMASARRRRA